MHSSVRRFFERLVDGRPPSGRVLEVGSYNVNGAIRDLFEGCDYTGIDIRDGPGVDRVVNQGGVIPYPRGHFDWVVSASQLEHDPRFWRTAQQMQYVLRSGGTIVVTAPGFGWPRHDEPVDYWRFSAEAFRSLFDQVTVAHVEETDEGNGPDVRMWGVRQ